MSSTTMPPQAKPGATAAGIDARPEQVRAFRIRRLKDWLWAAGGWVIFLGAWELAPALGFVNEAFSSSPSEWLAALWQLAVSGDLWSNALATLTTMGVGLALGIAIGVPAGIIFGWFPAMERLTTSVTSALYALPYVALLPLVVLWFGIDDTARAVIVFWAAVFPVLMNTFSGVRNLNRNLLRVARSFCAPQRRIVRTVVMPGSLPYILTGIRLAVGRALVAAVVAEFFMGSSGLGHIVSRSAATFQMDRAFAGLAVTALAGVVLVHLTGLVEQKYSSWAKAS